jgi:hypothetical protein
MASSGHRTSSASSSCSSNGFHSQLEVTPISPAKTKTQQQKPNTSAARQRQSGNSTGAPPPPPHPRLEDVLLFPAPTVSAAGTNLLTMTSGVGGGAIAGGGRRKNSAAKHNPQPFDDSPSNPTNVDDDFGVDPFPMQKQKKKKIPIIIDDEWDDVWAFPNEHLQQQQQQQQAVVVMEHQTADDDAQVLLSNSGSRHHAPAVHGSINELSGLPKPKPRSAWASSVLSPQNSNGAPSQNGAVLSPSHTKDGESMKMVSASGATGAMSSSGGAVGTRKLSGPSVAKASPSHAKPASLSPMNANPNTGSISNPVEDLSTLKDGVSSPMLPGPRPPTATPANMRAASEGARAPRAPSTELLPNSSMRRSKEGSFRRSFPGAGVGQVSSDTQVHHRTSFASPTEGADADAVVLSSALSPLSFTSVGDHGVTEGSTLGYPPMHAPPPPPPPSALPGGRQQAFTRKQHS